MELPRVLLEFPHALAWYHLGSTLRGDARQDSDIDLAILPYPGIMIDSNMVYAREALCTGLQLWTSDPDLAQRRAADLLHLYLRYLEDRKEVLDAYRIG